MALQQAVLLLIVYPHSLVTFAMSGKTKGQTETDRNNGKRRTSLSTNVSTQVYSNAKKLIQNNMHHGTL